MNNTLVGALLVFAAFPATASNLVCSPNGGFGQEFGAQTVSGVVTSIEVSGVTYTPPKAIPPFRYFDAGITPKSRKIWSAAGVAQFESAVAADAYRASLIETFQKTLTVTELVTTELGVTVIYTGSKGSKDTTIFGETKFYHTDGLKIEISIYTDNTNLRVTCSDLVLERLHISEVMAK